MSYKATIEAPSRTTRRDNRHGVGGRVPGNVLT